MKKQQVSTVGSSRQDAVVTIKYPSIRKTFERKLADYPAIVWDLYLPLHGIRQKLGDAASGKSAAEKYAEVLEIDAALMNGDWERTATRDLTPQICEAVARIMGKPVAKILKSLEQKPDQIDDWKASLKVKAMMKKIAAERAEEAAEDSEEDEIEVEGLE